MGSPQDVLRLEPVDHKFWIPAPAFAGVTIFRRNDNVWIYQFLNDLLRKFDGNGVNIREAFERAMVA